MTRQSNDRRYWTSDLPELRGPWLGQPLPGDTPTEFCPEVFTTGRHTFCTAFSPSGDELYFSTKTPAGEDADLAWMRLENGRWTRPEPAPFNSPWKEFDICMAPDGSRVAWRSWRPLPGHSELEEHSLLWAADRTELGWSEPFPIECDGQPLRSGYPGLARSGALYFTARTSPDEVSVYRAQRSGKHYIGKERIVGGMDSGGDLCIAPDESYLVISCWRRPDNNGESDLYISFRETDGTWSPLHNLGAPINNELNENCPMVSADGRWFFFFRYDPVTGTSHTYWTDANVLQSKQLDSNLSTAKDVTT